MSGKKIAIDARMYGKGFGLARYVESLVHGLQKYQSDFSYTLYLKPEEVRNYRMAGGNFDVIEAPMHWYGWDEQTRFLSLIHNGSHELMHFPHWNMPLLYRKKYVVTIHDLTMFHFSRYEATTRSRPVFWIKDMVHRLVVRHALKHADSIMAMSEYTKQDIMRTCGTPEERISVMYQAPYQHAKISTTVDASRLELLPDHPYLLYVGAAYPHKNLERLLDAWKMIYHNFPNHELILVGRKNKWYQQLEASCIRKGIGRVRMLGFVEDAQLSELYLGAEAVVFPSLHEGFGLPALEAMSRGVPVIVSHAGSLPEVVGGAGYYIDPTSVDHIAYGLTQVLGDPEMRRELSIQGREQAALFSEAVFIQKTGDVYKKALDMVP